MADYDVIVVGAGAAGIAATRTSTNAGLKVVCLEATSRVGGRAHTDTQIFGVPFDTGAHYIHCAHVNALKAPGLAMGLDLYADPDRSMTAGLNDDTELWDAVEAVFGKVDSALEAEQDTYSDLSLADVFEADGSWALTVQAMCCLSMARDLDQISLRDMHSWEGGDDWLCREGFGHLVARLADGLPIQLSTPVSNIQARPDDVRVTTSNSSLTARAVIVTASVGVLAEDVIHFDPPLAAEHRAALDRITMGDYGHTALLFQPNTLPVEADTWLTYKIDAAVGGVPQGGGFVCNVAGTGLTNFECGGSFSRSLQDAGSSAAIDHALETLVGIFGTDLRRHFLRGHATAWRKEPFVRGAYSGAMPGSSEYREILRSPHADRVFLAGEATHRGQQASVSGAYLEGQRAATEIITSQGVRCP